MSQICALCPPDRLFDDDAQICEDHVRALERYEPAADGPVSVETPEAAVTAAGPPGRTGCWNCGAQPHPANDECVECHRSLTPPTLVIRFRDGQVELERGMQVELGREGRYRRLFRSFGNVSRHHAVVGVDPDGRAWIEPNPTPNGTFVNQREIAPSQRRPLESHQVIRFALHAEGRVMVYRGGGVTA